MTGSRRLRPILGLLAGLAVLFGAVATGFAAPRTAVAAGASLPAWTGGVDLYRKGTFTTQKSWLWCTAAGVQIVRNIVDRDADHSTAGQRTYFDWMRERNRYDLPESAGVDPAGWTAGLRHFVDDRYRLVASRTFDAALRSAVENLRLTSLPVALTVSHGGHGWILTGFSATADPATTTSFKVTSVRVVGPLYGLQTKNGYDMAPNTKLTPTQLKRYFTPWKYEPKPMVWDGRYVSIQPVPEKAAVVVAPTASVAPATAPAPAPGSSPSSSPAATPASSSVAAVVPRASPVSPAAEGVTGIAPAASEGTAIGIVAISLGALAAFGAVFVGLAMRRRRLSG